MFRFVCIAVLATLLINVDLLGQRGEEVIIKDIPETGSGIAFGGSLTSYNTIRYNKEAVIPTQQEQNQQSHMERFLFENEASRIDIEPIQVAIRFHNNTKLDARSFSREVEYQLRALQRDFTIPINLQQGLIRSKEPPSKPIEFIEFKNIEEDYSSTIIKWAGWATQFFKIDKEEVVDIHVVDNLTNDMGHGYARHRWIKSEDNPDIVIRLSSFGSGSGIYNEGKVLTHLMGNYFGLLPLTGAGDCEDDGVEDTPIHNAAAMICFKGKQPTSLCDNQYYLTNNFMTHSPDACRDSFTKGQWRRMIFITNYLNK